MSELNARANETKIYVRDLNLDVTDEQFKEVFSEFGEIKTSSVKQIAVKTEQKKFGMIDFNTKEEAARALNEGPNNPAVKAITMNPE